MSTPAHPAAVAPVKRTSTRSASPWLAFAVALAFRIGIVVLFRLYRFSNLADHFPFGWEMGRIARSLATGHGYSDPFHGHTGPTAWVAPLYPLLMAAVFRLFGIYSNASALVLMLLNSLFNALVIFPLSQIAWRCFNRKIAFAAIWTWALYPFAMQYVPRIWSTALEALLFTWIVAIALRMRDIGLPRPAPDSTRHHPASLRRWLLFGLLWGVEALTNPSLLLFLPACILWILAGRTRTGLHQQLLRAALACLLCLTCIAPWAARNWRVFHQFIPMRANFGAELYLGNGPGANGLLMEYDHPNLSADQYLLYRRMGEVAYCRMRGAAAMAIIRQHAGLFALNSLRRLYYLWFGLPQEDDPNFILFYAPRANSVFVSTCAFFGLLLAFRNRIPGIALFAWAIVLVPLLYYFVTVEDRFLHPIAPLLYLLVLYLWTSAEESNRVRWFSRAY